MGLEGRLHHIKPLSRPRRPAALPKIEPVKRCGLFDSPPRKVRVPQSEEHIESAWVERIGHFEKSDGFLILIRERICQPQLEKYIDPIWSVFMRLRQRVDSFLVLFPADMRERLLLVNLRQ